jgi:peptidoglycan/LPS O-acetylase OafA/YrhL
MAGCGLVLLILLFRARTLFFSSTAMTSWGYTMIAGVYVCLLALALVPGTVANRVGSLSVLRFFGRYSYGLYVWHDLPSPVCINWQAWFTRHIHPLVIGQLVYAAAMLVLFTAVAVASYHLLELRFLKLKSRFRYAGPQEESPSLPKFQIADTTGSVSRSS